MDAARVALDPMASRLRHAQQALDAVTRALVFVLKALPWTSGAIDRVTAAPITETLVYPTHGGSAEADLFRPASAGPHPAVVVSLGVVPAGIEHPHRIRFGQALARAGFAALLHWSPAMRDLRLDPADVGDLVSAYSTLLDQPYADPTRGGLMGTCVGGSFALLAAAEPTIRDRLAFVSAYAPYASMQTLLRDVASGTRAIDGRREPWQVDPLVWKTFVRALTEPLDPVEAGRLRGAFEDRYAWDVTKTVVITSPAPASFDGSGLSVDARAVLALLTADGLDAVDQALEGLPPDIQAALTELSPIGSVERIRAPLIVLLHDRGDHMIPVSESRRLWSILAGRQGATYTELGFRHMDPTKLPLVQLARELPRLCFAIYRICRITEA
jgi:hypothetical protein